MRNPVGIESPLNVFLLEVAAGPAGIQVMKHILALSAALLLAPLSLGADNALKLAGLFTDHMVLQRDQAVPVWGWAKPGEEVRCEVKVAGFPHAMDVEFQTDWTGEKKFRYEARPNSVGWKSFVKLRVPADAKPGRVVIPVIARGPLGEVADPFFAVDVE